MQVLFPYEIFDKREKIVFLHFGPQDYLFYGDLYVADEFMREMEYGM